MSEKEDTNSKMERVEQAAQETFNKNYELDGLDNIEDLKFAYCHGFHSGSNWQKEHCYSEQEVMAMMDILRERCSNNAKAYLQGLCVSDDERIESDIQINGGYIEVDKQSILSVDYTDLLKTPPVK